MVQTTLKRSGMDHTAFNLQRTPCLPLPRERSPDGTSTECGGKHLIAAHYSFIYLERMKGWVGLVHRGLLLTDCNGQCWTPRHASSVEQASMIGDWRLALARWGRSGHSPPMSARQSAEVLDKLLCRCLRYCWSTTLSTLSPAGCNALSVQ